MNELLLRNVGDGLNLLIRNGTANYDLMVDFGGDEHIDHCWPLSGSFLLSHFHTDHYNGILNCYYNHAYSRHRPWDLDTCYYPAMPRFAEARQFRLYLYAMNIRISPLHPLQHTVLDIIKKLNKRSVAFQPVSRGDILLCAGRKYEILWPPRELIQEEALASIKKAIRDFEEARKVDARLAKIYEDVALHFQDHDIDSIIEKPDLETFVPSSTDEGELPGAIAQANDSLRRAANRLSIAFRQEDNMLFLGDLESRELGTIMIGLERDHHKVYDVLVAAHHGTHWHESMRTLSCGICLASVGETLRKYIRYEYRDIVGKLIRTDEWGDICIDRHSSIT